MSEQGSEIQKGRYRLDIDQIRNWLPHRAPFLLVDRVLDIFPNGTLTDLSPANMVGIKVVALKNVSYNEPFFQGHFPQFSIFPGVLMIEAMAQASSFALYPYVEKDLDLKTHTSDLECILLGIDGVRFRKPVIPGDSLVIESTVSKCRGTIWGFHCVALVDGQKVAEADVMANMGRKTSQAKK
jgi:3-hydroxyacyl-[acyl-carrier-protein] dehydratase